MHLFSGSATAARPDDTQESSKYRPHEAGRIAITLHTQRKVNVVRVDPLVAPEHRVGTDIDVDFLLSIADLLPDAWILKIGAAEFL